MWVLYYDAARRARIFAFPQQMGALRESLAEFVSEIFGSTRFDRQILLRGVYFTSGTQEGTPIDRLLAPEFQLRTPGGATRRVIVRADESSCRRIPAYGSRRPSAKPGWF